MSAKPTAAQCLDREFLEIRCRLLDIASALDRMGRAEGSERLLLDPRMEQLLLAGNVLLDGNPDRAQRIQMVFSDAYDSVWRK